MEIILELSLTAFVALVFSFLIAKVVSLAMGGDSVFGVEGKPLMGGADDDIIMEQLEFAEKLKVQGIEISEKKVDFVKESVDNKVDVFEQVDDQGFESEKKVECCEESSEKADGFQVVEGVVVERSKVEAFESEKEVEFMEETARVVEAEVELKLDDVVVEKKIEEIGEGIEAENETIVQYEESQMKVLGEEEKEVKLESYDDDDDDDWEGIEKSELEKVFEAASKFIEKKGDLGIGNDEQMELYGLHKIATEGPCRDPQPLAFMVSSRSKWNAWQRLGNMNPEEAMVQYVTLLSDKVPGWTEDKSDGEGKLETADQGVPDKQAVFKHERIVELKSAPGGGDITGSTSFEKQAKDD